MIKVSNYLIFMDSDSKNQLVFIQIG